MKTEYNSEYYHKDDVEAMPWRALLMGVIVGALIAMLLLGIVK